MTMQERNVLPSSPSSYLLDSGAFPAPVNNEGDTPEDLADDDVIRELITEAIEKQGTAILHILFETWRCQCPMWCVNLGVSVADAKTREESLMLIDANRLRNDPSLAPAVSPGGATVIHVAAAKNYLQVLE